MDRVSLSTDGVVADQNGDGKQGFNDENPNKTVVPASFMNDVQEALMYPMDVMGDTGISGEAGFQQAYEGFRDLAIADMAILNWFAHEGASGETDNLHCITRATAAIPPATDNVAEIVCAGENGMVQYSNNDGVGWTVEAAAGAYAGTFYGAATAASGLHCLVGTAGEIQTGAALSGSSLTHRTQAGAYAGDFRDVAHNGLTGGSALFVAVGTLGEIQTSPDGITWTARTSGVATTLFSVAYGNGVWVIRGASAVALSSTDGVTWTSRTAAGTDPTNGGSVVWDALRGAFFCAATNPSYSSTNGQVWTALGALSGVTTSAGIATDNFRNMIMACAVSGTAQYRKFQTTVYGAAISTAPVALNAILYTGRVWVGVGNNNNMVLSMRLS